jgi:large subunit ribosomal protein L21e
LLRSFGYRARTRDLFSRKFRKAGRLPISGTYMPIYKVGDYVDVVANSAQQKGMPHRFYHGRTGIVFNVTNSSVGVEVNKQLRNHILKKRIHVRVEHVRHSKCRQGFLDRVKRIEATKKAAKAEGTVAPVSALRRLPAQPKVGYFVEPKCRGELLPIVVAPKPFNEML